MAAAPDDEGGRVKLTKENPITEKFTLRSNARSGT